MTDSVGMDYFSAAGLRRLRVVALSPTRRADHRLS
jgi:hypothetical protein